MKLSEWAKKQGLCYGTAFRHFKAGLIPNSRQLSTSTILVDEPEVRHQLDQRTVALYARVSSHKQKEDLIRQLERLQQYAETNGWTVTEQVKEIASGMNDDRPLLNKLLAKNTYYRILVENKDRLTRFGFNYLRQLASKDGKVIEAINQVDEPRDALVQDLISVIYSFSAKLYGSRKAKQKADKILEELELTNDDDQVCPPTSDTGVEAVPIGS